VLFCKRVHGSLSCTCLHARISNTFTESESRFVKSNIPLVWLMGVSRIRVKLIRVGVRFMIMTTLCRFTATLTPCIWKTVYSSHPKALQIIYGVYISMVWPADVEGIFASSPLRLDVVDDQRSTDVIQARLKLRDVIVAYYDVTSGSAAARSPLFRHQRCTSQHHCKASTRAVIQF